MLRSLSEDVVVNIKDRLRDVRHFIRSSRHDNPGGLRRLQPADFPPAEIERLLGRAASVVDDTLTVAETVSLSLLPIVRPDDGARLHGFETYFALDRTAAVEGERLFRRDVYAALKAWLRLRTDNPPLIHEASFSQAYQAIRRKHGELLAAMRNAGRADRLDAVAAVTAATLVELLASQPLQLAGIDETVGAHPNLQPLAPVALAAGIATLSPSGMNDADLIESAGMAAEARRDRIARALDGADPVRDLTAIFAVLLAHLP